MYIRANQNSMYFLFKESMARTLEVRLLGATKSSNYEWIEIEG